MCLNNNQGREGLSKTPLLLSLIMGTFIILAITVSILNPLFEATDETRHYRYVRYLVLEKALPIQGEGEARSQSHHPPLYYFVSALFSAPFPSTYTANYRQPMNPFWGYRSWAVGVDNKLQYWHGPEEPFGDGYITALIPRWVNVIIGAVTVWLTFCLGKHVFPQRPWLALGVTSIVTLNPQFIYLSAAMNNDIIAAVCSSAILLECFKLLETGPNWKNISLLGLTYGLALLSKLHLAVMGAVIAVTLWKISKTEGNVLKRVVPWSKNMVLILVVAACLSGWWFVRNWMLYGDPTGMNKVNELWAGRSVSGNWWALWEGLPYLWSSLWGRFGYGQIPMPTWIYTTIFILCLLGVVGCLSWPTSKKCSAALIQISGLTILLFTGIVAYYILIQPAGPMGRFLFPALPAFAILVIVGWDNWFKHTQWVGLGALASMLTLCIVALGGYLWPAIRYPPQHPLTQPKAPDKIIQFGDLAQVLDVTVEPKTVRAGEPVFITVVWNPLRWTSTPHIVYIHLLDEVGVLVAQRDTWPGLSRAPTTSWKANFPFVDKYRIDLPTATYAPNQVSVRLGIYEPDLGRLPVYVDGQLSPHVDSLEAGSVTISPNSGPWPNVQNTNFNNEVILVGYMLNPRVLSAGETLTLTLYWKPTDEIRYAYSVFAQVIDPAYQVWGSFDSVGPVWIPGEIVTETRRITLRPETPTGSYPLQVGLYHADVGRLRVLNEAGNPVEERVLLGPIQVRP